MSGTLTVLATLSAQGGLTADANGDLFGITARGSSDVYEIANTATGYAATPNVVANLPSSYGTSEWQSLAIDDNGDLIGTAVVPSGAGVVYEIANTASGYATTPNILVTFDGGDGAVPLGGVILDANGDLIGTASGEGLYGDGSVFEVANTATGYASTPTVLASFNGTDGAAPQGSLLEDASGDLFGTTVGGGTGGQGTVFEIANTPTGYASAPITLFSFGVPFSPVQYIFPDGANPTAGLVMDSVGDLFGIASNGGSGGLGTVFELVKNGSSYASTPTILASFNGVTGGDGRYSNASLLIDAEGNLFGTTDESGTVEIYNGITYYPGGGTVFEIANTPTGYASAPTVLAAFPPPQATSDEVSSLVANAAGDLFGTTVLGGDDGTAGTVFEVSDTGYQVSCFVAGTKIATPGGRCAVEDLSVGDLVISARRGTAVRVSWLGHRDVDCTRYRDPAAAYPIRVRVDAFGRGLPARDLWLSPDHAIFAEGVLIPVRVLVNGTSVARQALPRVAYWHVEVDQHDVLLAEGLPVESYLDAGQRAAFIDGRVTALAPDFASRVWEAQACAPMRVVGPEVDAVRARLGALRDGGDSKAA